MYKFHGITLLFLTLHLTLSLPLAGLEVIVCEAWGVLFLESCGEEMQCAYVDCSSDCFK
jgi:hypothetical protein